VADESLRRDFPSENLSDETWTEVTVPGSWCGHPEFADVDGPVLYRTRFPTTSLDAGRRLFLRLEGIAYQGDVWLDGSYLGPTEGSFVPHLLEITSQARVRSEHLLAVEVACPPVADPDAKRTLTGTTQTGRGIPEVNPGGIVGHVSLHETGPVPFLHTRMVCTQATESVATLALRAVVHSDRPRAAVFRTRVLGIDHRHQQPLAGGENRVEWTIRVPRPPLWWPATLGDQPLHDVEVAVATEDGLVSDEVFWRTGFRSVRMRNHIWSVNGERLFLCGAIVPPLAADLARVTADTAANDVAAARNAGLNLLRVTGHVSSPHLYAEADRTGMLLWQDTSLTGGYHRDVRPEAARQAREMVDLLGHHPSIVVWCGHDAPGPIDRTRAAPRILDQQKPTWNRTVLDRTVRRALNQADPSRPVISHSGVLPNLPRLDDADSNLWFGWYSGRRGDLAHYLDRLPRAGRFVSAFGSQSIPDDPELLRTLSERTTDHAGNYSTAWPAVDADRLTALGAEFDVLVRRFPPGDRSDAGAWAEATRRHQASLLRIQIEALRLRKYRPTGGFAIDRLLDGSPAISGSLMDHYRRPKPALEAVAAACAPTVIVADPPVEAVAPRSIIRTRAVAIHDGRLPIESCRVDAVLCVNDNPSRTTERSWGGALEPDSVTHIGTLELDLGDATGAVSLELTLSFDGPDGPTVISNKYLGRIGVD